MIARGIPQLDKHSVLSRVTDKELLSCYFPQVKEIPCIINSPLRKENNPSFRFHSPDGDHIRWYDFGNGAHGGMTDLIMEVFHLDFGGLLAKIERDIAQYRSNPVTSVNHQNIKVRKGDMSGTIRTKMRAWNEEDFAYWSSYGVPKEWLLHSDVYPVSLIFIVNDGYVRTIKADPLAYTFVERKDGVVSEKVYQPLNQQGYKWRSGHDSSVWDLWTKLPPRGKRLIITSSRKDAMCLWANTGIPTVSLQGETVGVKPQVMQEIKDRFEKVYVLYDNDFKSAVNSGRLQGEKLANQFGLIQIELPERLGCKDSSDLYHKWGGKVLKDTILSLLCGK